MHRRERAKEKMGHTLDQLNDMLNRRKWEDKVDTPELQPSAENLIETIRTLLDDNERHTVTSKIYRMNENPPSAAWHLVLGGKRYILILQPTDMPDMRTYRT